MPDNKKYIIEIDGIEGQSVKDANWWAEKKDSLGGTVIGPAPISSQSPSLSFLTFRISIIDFTPVPGILSEYLLRAQEIEPTSNRHSVPEFSGVFHVLGHDSA